MCILPSQINPLLRISQSFSRLFISTGPPACYVGSEKFSLNTIVPVFIVLNFANFVVPLDSGTLWFLSRLNATACQVIKESSEQLLLSDSMPTSGVSSDFKSVMIFGGI